MRLYYTLYIWIRLLTKGENNNHWEEEKKKENACKCKIYILQEIEILYMTQ